MKIKFKKGQKVVCVHYKAKPVVTVDHYDTRNDEVWVWEPHKKLERHYWWGPKSWFKRIKNAR